LKFEFFGLRRGNGYELALGEELFLGPPGPPGPGPPGPNKPQQSTISFFEGSCMEGAKRIAF
jgi:hypothetical protein